MTNQQNMKQTCGRNDNLVDFGITAGESNYGRQVQHKYPC